VLKRLNHVGYRIRDAAATRAFYADGLGLAFKGASWAKAVPEIDLHSPHIHLIFQLPDGSTIDLFEILDGNERTVPVENDFAQHLALEVDTDADAESIVERLKAMGVSVKGPMNHPLGHSWYFFDPSGHRLELAVKAPPEQEQAVWSYLGKTAAESLAKWAAHKARGRES
jgi:catechol 2,3-dioxygenase-like lactoylglutathione lyase family enzyme